MPQSNSLSFCAGCRLFFWRGEAFPNSVAHILNLVAYRAAGFFSACGCEQYSDSYSETDARCKVNGVAYGMVLLAVKCLSGSVSEVFNPILYTISHVRCDPVGLLKQINSSFK